MRSGSRRPHPHPESGAAAAVPQLICGRVEAAFSGAAAHADHGEGLAAGRLRRAPGDHDRVAVAPGLYVAGGAQRQRLQPDDRDTERTHRGRLAAGRRRVHDHSDGAPRPRPDRSADADDPGAPERERPRALGAAPARDDRAQIAGGAAPHPCAHRRGGVEPLARFDGHPQPRRGTRRRGRTLEGDVQAPVRCAAGVVGPRDRSAAVGGGTGRRDRWRCASASRASAPARRHRRDRRPQRPEGRCKRRPAGPRRPREHDPPVRRHGGLQPRRVEDDRRGLEGDRRMEVELRCVELRIRTGSATRRAVNGPALSRVSASTPAIDSPVRHATTAPPPLRTAIVGSPNLLPRGSGTATAENPTARGARSNTSRTPLPGA